MLSLFMTTPCGDHVPRGTTGDVEIRKVGPVLVVHRNETLPRVFRKLAVEGFLSAPVVEGTRYVGYIDMMDLVKKTTDLFFGESVEAWVQFWEKEERFQETTIDDVMKTPNTFDRDPNPPICSDFSTFSALEMIVRGNYHRLAVTKPNSSRLECILTESMLISWIRQHKSLLGNLRGRSVGDLTSDLKTPVFTIHETKRAINAFNKMALENVSGVAVVDDNEELVNTISIRDLRAVGTSGEFFHRLFRPIKEFKKLGREEHSKLAPRTHYSSKLVPRRALYVTMDQTFEDVLDKMYDGNIHRVWVCESASRPKPQFVFSQVDVLRAVMHHIEQEAEGFEVTA